MGVRRPAVAGQFYPAGRGPLLHDVEAFVSAADVTPAPERVAAVVAPHAGYLYSGPTAGFAFARVRDKKPRRVFLLGGSHRYAIATASVCRSDAFETPVGTFPVDRAFADRLADAFESEPDVPHRAEHALEVQLPFLVVAVGLVPIVPVLFGSPASPQHAAFGRLLAELADPSDLVIASTDLSHYLTQEEAHQQDKRTLDAFLSKDPSGFVIALGRGAGSMCGGCAVVAAMAYALARGATDWSVLDYRTSAEASGDYSHVVGYAALSMEFPE